MSYNNFNTYVNVEKADELNGHKATPQHDEEHFAGDGVVEAYDLSHRDKRMTRALLKEFADTGTFYIYLAVYKKLHADQSDYHREQLAGLTMAEFDAFCGVIGKIRKEIDRRMQEKAAAASADGESTKKNPVAGRKRKPVTDDGASSTNKKTVKDFY